ncbi:MULTISPECIES: hypothetical protein [Chitinibacter]|jgi:hypothetical protein|uniref:hypothetical protein n=1 Tax=Chitinibacter TaxID=230666 RepID=UPI000422B783|nr:MULTISPECIES: hypothetical protein [Chitinibacter]
MRKLLFLLLLTVSMSSFAARVLPNGKLAQLQGFLPPQVKLDDKVYVTAPGLQIRSVNNTLIMPNQLPQSATVWYQTEPNTGFVWRIWLVSEDEAKLLKVRAEQQKAIANEQ